MTMMIMVRGLVVMLSISRAPAFIAKLRVRARLECAAFYHHEQGNRTRYKVIIFPVCDEYYYSHWALLTSFQVL